MWIVPKTLSAFVPDTEGLNLGLDERAWMLEQSAMWRSKPSSKQTWLRRLKKGGWITHLSTRILKPSQQKYFEEKFTDSLEDIHVSPSVVRESEKEKKTQGTYGHTSEDMSGQLDLFGASLKMSEDTPRWGYGESCPIWKKMVTERSGDCSARRKQARLTNASESSSWQNYPTPAARDYKGTNSEHHVMNKSKGYKGHMNQLPNFIKYSKWPTPRAGNPGSRKPGTGGKILAEEAKIHRWPARPGEEQYEWEEPRVVADCSVKRCGGRKNKDGKDGEGISEQEGEERSILRSKTEGCSGDGETTHDEAQSELVRAVDGLTHRVDRLRLLGNGVVPQTAEIAWKTLWRKMNEDNH